MDNEVTNWEDYVRDEINKLLDTFLPVSESGNVGIRYAHPVIEVTESGPSLDDSKAVGVNINLIFTFTKPINTP